MVEPTPRLGEVLVKLGLATRHQVQHALGLQRTSRAKLGEVMVAAGFITRTQLESALSEQCRRATGGILGLAMMTLQPTSVLAGSSAVLTIRGEIPAVSSIQLTQANVQLPTDLRRPVENAVITSVTERSNSRGAYTVTIVSDAAQSTGRPALVNPESGATIPYRLTYGDEELRFDGGRAVLERPTAKASQSQAIAISTQPGAALVSGQYGDRLTLVLSTR